MATKTLRLRVTPFFDIVLGEDANGTRGILKTEIVDDVLMFENPQATIFSAESPSSPPACSIR